MPTLSRAVASLRIVGEDLVPAEVTELLGRSPTFASARGEELTSKHGAARTARFGIWSYAAPETTPADLDAQVAEIVSDLAPDLGTWRQLAARFKVDLFCGWFLDRINEGISISPKTLRLLAERNIRLDLDLYANFDGDVNEAVSHARYHQLIEELSGNVIEEAAVEGWLRFPPEDQEQSPLQRSINQLARNLRIRHFDGDGCVDH